MELELGVDIGIVLFNFNSCVWFAIWKWNSNSELNSMKLDFSVKVCLSILWEVSEELEFRV